MQNRSVIQYQVCVVHFFFNDLLVLRIRDPQNQKLMPASHGPKFERDLTSFKPLQYHVFENIMENGTFPLLEQMLHFHNIFICMIMHQDLA